MRNSAVKIESRTDDANAQAADQFALELSDLCRKYGLGIGDATLFEMQPDDFQHSYHVDEDSKLLFG
jgi:hypothetical protein